MIGKSGAHAARAGGFEIIDQDGEIERRMDAHKNVCYRIDRLDSDPGTPSASPIGP